MTDTLPNDPLPADGVGQDATINEAQSEEDYCDEMTRPYRRQISDTPGLLSLLYDIDLLPEQIVKAVNVGRMCAVCELWKVAYPPAPPSNTGQDT